MSADSWKLFADQREDTAEGGLTLRIIVHHDSKGKQGELEEDHHQKEEEEFEKDL
jgi:hypothetical protein